MTKLSQKTVSEQWCHQPLVDTWLSSIDARRQYMLLVKIGQVHQMKLRCITTNQWLVIIIHAGWHQCEAPLMADNLHSG